MQGVNNQFINSLRKNEPSQNKLANKKQPKTVRNRRFSVNINSLQKYDKKNQLKPRISSSAQIHLKIKNNLKEINRQKISGPIKIIKQNNKQIQINQQQEGGSSSNRGRWCQSVDINSILCNNNSNENINNVRQVKDRLEREHQIQLGQRVPETQALQEKVQELSDKRDQMIGKESGKTSDMLSQVRQQWSAQWSAQSKHQPLMLNSQGKQQLSNIKNDTPLPAHPQLHSLNPSDLKAFNLLPPSSLHNSKLNKAFICPDSTDSRVVTNEFNLQHSPVKQSTPTTDYSLLILKIDASIQMLTQDTNKDKNIIGCIQKLNKLKLKIKNRNVKQNQNKDFDQLFLDIQEEINKLNQKNKMSQKKEQKRQRRWTEIFSNPFTFVLSSKKQL